MNIFGTPGGTLSAIMVQTRHQTHESAQNQQVEDLPNVVSEENMIGQNDQDSVGATSEVLSLQLVPLITQGQQNHLELMGIMKGFYTKYKFLDRENWFISYSTSTTSGGLGALKAITF